MLVFDFVPNIVPYAITLIITHQKIILFTTRVFISLNVSLYAPLKYPSKSKMEWKLEFNFSSLLELQGIVTKLDS